MNVIKKVFFIALMICTLSVVSNASTGKINTDGARMRREPNTTSDVLTIVYSGETVEIVEKQGEWYKVKYAEHQGYIREDLMQLEEQIQETVAEPEEQKPEVKPEPEPEAKPEEGDLPTEPENIQVEKQVRIDMGAKILPSFSASNVADLKQGEKVVVTGQMNKWSCITVANKTAWVLTSNLEEIQQVEEQPEPEPEPEPEDTTKTMYISVSAAVLRSGASTSSDAILEMHRGDSVEVLSEEEEWCKIKYGEQEGYVAKRLLSESYEETHRSLINERRESQEEVKQEETEPEPEEVVAEETEEVTTSNTTGEEVVAYAKQFLGCKYVYGGAGPNSFDCSGFTKYVYGHFGISLTHNAAVQANNGTYVEKANLQVGDLVIFRDSDNSSIGHCGIYIGGGNFIHAANSRRGVVTDTLNSGYYYERYVSARRLF